MLRSVDWYLSYRRFGTPYRCHLLGSSNPVFLDCWTLEDEIHWLFGNVGNYQSPLRNIPGKQSSRLYGGGSLRSRRGDFIGLLHKAFKMCRHVMPQGREKEGEISIKQGEDKEIGVDFRHKI